MLLVLLVVDVVGEEVKGRHGVQGLPLAALRRTVEGWVAGSAYHRFASAVAVQLVSPLKIFGASDVVAEL